MGQAKKLLRQESPENLTSQEKQVFKEGQRAMEASIPGLGKQESTSTTRGETYQRGDEITQALNYRVGWWGTLRSVHVSQMQSNTK